MRIKEYSQYSMTGFFLQDVIIFWLNFEESSQVPKIK